MRRHSLVIVCAAAALSCGENPFAPNTDVGLRVWAEVTPASLSVRDTLAEIRIRVNVRNAGWRVIRVVSGGPPYRFTSDPTESRGLWGSFRVACVSSPLNCGPNTDWWGDSVYVFEPRTTQYDEAIFTLRSWKAGGWSANPGEYRIRAWFNAREGEPASFTLLP